MLKLIGKGKAPAQIELGDTTVFGRVAPAGSRDPFQAIDSVSYPGLVSRVHATITRKGDGYEIVDNKSTNGLLVDKK